MFFGELIANGHTSYEFQPRTPIVIGGRYNVEGPPEPRGFPVVIGATHGGGRRPGGFGGGGGGLSLGDLEEVTEGRRR